MSNMIKFEAYNEDCLLVGGKGGIKYPLSGLLDEVTINGETFSFRDISSDTTIIGSKGSKATLWTAHVSGRDYIENEMIYNAI